MHRLLRLLRLLHQRIGSGARQNQRRDIGRIEDAVLHRFDDRIRAVRDHG